MASQWIGFDITPQHPLRSSIVGASRTPFITLFWRALLLTAMCTLTTSCERCSSDKKTSDQGRKDVSLELGEPGEPEYGGSVVVGITSEPDTLLPIGSKSRLADDIESLLYVGLTNLLPDLKTVAPSLATHWDFSADRKALTFQLRHDVAWSDGTPTTAEDVLFSYTLCKNPKTHWPGFRHLKLIREARVIDAYAIQFIFDRASSEWFQLFDASVFPILPKHILEKIPIEELKNSAQNREPITNGPFRLSKWEPRQVIELVANADFKPRRPYLDKVTFKFLPDEGSLFLGLKNREMDYHPDLPPEYYEEAKKISSLKEYRYDAAQYAAIAWNVGRPLFADKTVRQALTMAIPKEMIVEKALHGLGKIAHGPTPSPIWGHNPNVIQFSYNMETAQRLLAEAGWKATTNGDPLIKGRLPFTFTLKTRKENPTLRIAVEIIQEHLSQLGIETKPEFLEQEAFFNDADSGSFDALLLNWAPSPKNDLETIWHSRSILNGYNLIGYSNQLVDKLIDNADIETDSQKLLELLEQTQNTIAEDQPYTFLYTSDTAAFADAHIQGVTSHPRHKIYKLEDWWIPKVWQNKKG